MLCVGSALSSVDLKYIVLATNVVVGQHAFVLATEQELSEKVNSERKSVERADAGEQERSYPTTLFSVPRRSPSADTQHKRGSLLTT